MSENSTIPYLLQLKDAVNAIHLSENEVNSIGIFTKPTNTMFVPGFIQSTEQICIEPTLKIKEESVDTSMEVESESITNAHVNIVYEVVYPEQLNLKPICNNLKRGRPQKKKKKVEEAHPLTPPTEPPKIVKPMARTRSGRVVKFPKYREEDFIEVKTEDSVVNNEESKIKTSDSTTFDEDVKDNKKDVKDKVQLDFHQRRRNISSQYRCPKCKKAYLGKSRMIQHIRKYPDHGPVPQNEINFDVWNYLVDITQKCPPAHRGIKFCDELTNLLHNVLLLTSALFKEAELNKNYVEVDKVLGNAIGLSPGFYKFNDSQLYKDVTVLKLITNSDFFKPVSTIENMSVEPTSENVGQKETVQKDVNVLNGAHGDSAIEETTKDPSARSTASQNLNNFAAPKIECENSKVDASPIMANHQSSDISYNKDSTSSSTPDFAKKNEHVDNRLPVPQDLLSDNSLLHLPNLRVSVDELILSSVDTGTNLLDNSTSSDEVMNVDQFVNERFKKITEPEAEMAMVGLNLELPSLDLFHFHTS